MSDDLIGRKLGEYQILGKLGSGGMATVYRARQDGFTEDIALKLMAERLNISNELAHRFEREARVMKSFDHPNILPVYDFGKVDQYTYITMKLLDAGTLHHHLQQNPVTVDEIVEFLAQVAEALDYAHERQVVHRDLKPANILIGEGGHVYLADFGIAKLKEESIAITPTDMLLGTPGYMAPEQWRSEPVDARTDVYAFGIMTYEILCGDLPFYADTPFGMMYSHLDEPPPLLSRCRSDLPPTIDTVIRRALAKIAQRRYPSAGAFIASLKLALEDTQAASDITPSLHMDDADTYITPSPLEHPTTRARKPEPTPITEGDYTLDIRKTPPSLEGATLATTDQTFMTDPYEIDEEYANYNAVDVGARSLLQRAREAALETSGDDAALAQSVINYVQDMREVATHRTNPQTGPYRALESYDIGDYRLFFGREAAIDGMLARSPEARFTVLHAESGAGKTSLIRAGIMSRLLAGGYLSLYVAVRRRAPQEALKRVLIADPSQMPTLTAQPLRTYFKKLAAMLNRDIFIFIDQFETFFTDVFSDAERAGFITELAECLDDPLLPIRVTVAMRTEYFGLLSSFQPQVAQPFANEMLLRSLTLEEAKRALWLPARLQSYEYEEGIIDQILDDLSDASQVVAPPQLQLVGGALIDQLPEGRKQIYHTDYQAAGGAEGILRSYLERLLSGIALKQRTLARRIIEGLVRADQTRDVRTPASLHDELSALDIDTSDLETVLQTLRENRVLRLVELDSEVAYELVHDYLALQVQLDPETAARKAAQELLERRVADYLRYGSLLTQQELDVIASQQAQLAITPDAERLITQTKAVRQRQRRLALALSVVAILGVIGALGLGLFAAMRESQNQQERLELSQTSEARITTERDTARLAESRMLADLAMQQLTVDPMTSLNLAVEALTPLDRPYVPAAEFALSRALQTVNEKLYLPSDGRVNGARWNADESQILTWSIDGSVRLFDSTTGELIYQLDHSSAIIAAAWSPDEHYLLTAERAGTAYMREAATGKILQTLSGHSDSLLGAAWNHRGDSILTWSRDGTAILWNIEEGQPMTTLSEPSVMLASWSPDDRQVLTINENHIINIWLVDSGEQIISFDEHVNTIQNAVWNADGSSILSWGDDRSAIVWAAQTGDVLLRLDAHADVVTFAGWSPDERQILTTSFAGEAIIWGAESGEELFRITAEDVIDGGVWNPDGQQVILYGEPSASFLWDLPSNAIIAQFDQHTDTLIGASWHDEHILTYSQDGTARIWDSTTGQLITVMRGHLQPLTSAIWHSDGSHILTAGADGSARVWSVGNPDGILQTLASEHGQVFAAAWSPDETLIASAHQDGSVLLWDVATSEIIWAAQPHTDMVRYLAWSPDGQHIATGSDDGTVQITDLSGDSQRLQDHGASLTTVRWNASGTQLLSSGEDGSARVTNPSDGVEVLRLQQAAGIWFSAWNRDETQIITTGEDGTVRIWDAISGDTLQTIAVSNFPVLGARWNQDESTVLVWGFDNMAHLVAVDGTPVMSFEGHQDWVVDALWSPDETKIITANSDTTLRIWDVASGQTVAILDAHQDSVIGLASYQNGFLSRSVDGTVRAWDIDTGQAVLLLDGHQGRIRAVVANTNNTRLLTASDDGTIRIWQTWSNLAAMVSAAEAETTRP